MAVAFDASSVGFVSGADATVAFTHTATAGAYLVVGIASSGASPVSSVTYGGTAMSLLGGPYYLGSPYGPCYLYGLARVSGGAATVSAAFSGIGYHEVAAASYTGVGTVDTIQVAGPAGGNAMSQTATIGAADSMIVQVFAAGDNFADAAMSSFTGGTNRQSDYGSGYASISLSDATATTTFGASASMSGAAAWVGLAVVLESAQVTVRPTTATVALSTSTPGISVGNLGSAYVLITGNPASVGIGVAPTTATVALSVSTPSVGIVPSVAYDATGTGAFGTGGGTPGSTLTWTHTFGANASCVVVGVNGHGAGGTDVAANFTRTLKLGTTPLKLYAVRDLFTGDGWAELWVLQGDLVRALAGTTQTFTLNEYFTAAPSSDPPALIANSVSYSHVQSVGPASTNGGYSTFTPVTPSILSSQGHMVVAVQGTSHVSTCTGTIRYNQTYAGYIIGGLYGDEDLLIADTPGSGVLAGVTISSNGNGYFAAIGVDLSNIDQVFYDSAGSPVVGGTSTGSFGWNHNSTPGAYVIAAIGVNSPVTLTGVSHAGLPMTLLGSVPVAGADNPNGSVYFYGINNSPGGANTIGVNLAPNAYVFADSVSYVNVGQAALALNNSGASGPLSLGPVACGSGQTALNVFYGRGTAALTQAGGISIYAGTQLGYALAIQEALSTATFTATPATSAPWAAGAVLLTPPLFAQITITTYTPLTSVTGPVNVSPPAAQILLTTRTSTTIVGPWTTPTSVTVTVTCATPGVVATGNKFAAPAGKTITLTTTTPGVSGLITVITPRGASITLIPGVAVIPGIAYVPPPISITGTKIRVRYPGGPITPHGACHVLSDRLPIMAYRSYDDTAVFNVSGGPSIADRAAPEAIRITGIKGLIPPWQNIEQKGATQDGATYVTSLYDPIDVDLEVHATGRNPAFTRQVVRDWIESWDAKRPGELSWFTQQLGRWWAPIRWGKQPVDKLCGGNKTYEKFTWVAKAYDGFWRSYDHVEQFNFDYADTVDPFDVTYTGTHTTTDLGPAWTCHYSSAGGWISSANAATIIGLTLQFPFGGYAYWTNDPANPIGPSGCTVVCRRNNFTTITDNQVITVQLGSVDEVGFPANAFTDLWGRMDTSALPGANGIRLRFGVGSMTLSMFVGGTETILRAQPLIIPPIPAEKWSLVCGYGGNEALFQVQRNGLTIMNVLAPNTSAVTGAGYRGVGFGMQAGDATFLGQAKPAAILIWKAGDNDTITQTGFLPRQNWGDQPMFDRMTCYGPGTFTIQDGPGSSNQITFGPLLDGQIMQLRTDPTKRGVVDLTGTPPAPTQSALWKTALADFISFATANNAPPLLTAIESALGIIPPQGNPYSLLNGRFSDNAGIPAKPPGQIPQVYEVAVGIANGNASSRIVAAGTPLRRYPF